jgi:hypothetical protein
MEVDNIDALLERYLNLLHEYTALRTELSGLQTSMYQSIARANFSAERGMRFGQDHYDDRMQASRRLHINANQQDVPSFQVARGDLTCKSSDTDANVPDETEEVADVGDTLDENAEKGEEQDSEPTSKPRKMKKDPLQWFGLLTPMPLRQAQNQSLRIVEQIVPKLASTNAEMASVEIEVRRARKKRAKAEAASNKQQEGIASKEITA